MKFDFDSSINSHPGDYRPISELWTTPADGGGAGSPGVIGHMHLRGLVEGADGASVSSRSRTRTDDRDEGSRCISYFTNLIRNVSRYGVPGPAPEAIRQSSQAVRGWHPNTR